jgi:hypothetical protein
MDHPNAHKLHGGPHQVLRDSPYHQEQPLGCRLCGDGQCPLHRGYSHDYHLESPPSCMEEPVKLDPQHGSQVSKGYAYGPQEQQEAFLSRSTMRKPGPTRPRLQQPPRRLSACPRSARMGEGPIKEPPKRAILPSTTSGARQRAGSIPLTIPSSVVDLRRTASQRTSLLSPLTPQKSPGKREVAEILVRWLI